MSFLEQFFAITRNTFLESIRQPVVFVIAVTATLFIVLSLALATFTLESDQQMYIDIGLSSVFLAGVIGSAFIATNVLTREIENKTVLTVVSKPVPRPIFIFGKFVGAAVCLLVLMTYLVLVFMVVELHGSLETAATKYHMPVIVFGSCGLLLGVCIGIWCNFFYGWAFGSTTLLTLVPVSILVYILSLVFGREWISQSIGTEFDSQLWIAAGMLFVAVLILTSIAIAASTRLGQLLTLLVTCGFFLMGLLSDWLFGRPAAQIMNRINEGAVDASVDTDAVVAPASVQGLEMFEYWGLTLAHKVVPNFQVFWLADAVNQGHPIPAQYVLITLGYGALLIGAALCVAIMLFQRREVG
jgi:hypothetical protein